MRNRRKAVTVLLATLACLLVLLVVFLNNLIGKNRERIREEIEKSLGRSVRFDELRLSFWGGIGLRAKRVSLAEDPRFAATPFIQAQELKMQFRWLPLLLGNIAIDSFVLDEPEIQIIRNEQGTLNLSALAGAERRARETKREAGEPKEAKPRAGLALLPAAIYMTKGRIDYIDRSFKEPVEVRIRNLRMEIKGMARSGGAKVKLKAGLFEGQGQNITLEGVIGPLRSDRDWKHQPLDFHARLDSLLLPQLSRSVPFLRETLAPYTGVTGPLVIEARFLGTLEEPRVNGLTVTGTAFGAAENNASLKADVDFSKGSSWKEGEIKGKIVVDPAGLEYLKKIPFLTQTLPSSLASDGPLSVTGELQGSLDNLKARVLIRAAQSEIRYGSWLSKAKGVPAEMELKVERQRDRVVFEESSLTLNNLKLRFSGLVEEFPERRLTLRLTSNDLDLSGWERLLPPLSSLAIGGVVRWDLSIKKNLGLDAGDLDTRGSLNLDRFHAKDKKSGRGVERMTARLSFRGKEARIESAEGSLDGIPLSNVKGDIVSLPHGFGLRNLSLQALGGMLRANGAWETRPDKAVRVALAPNIEAMDLKQLLSHELPNFKDHIEGRVSFRANLWAEAKDGAALKDNLQGEGTTQVRGGALKDFNLVERVLSKVTGLPGVPSLISARTPARYNVVLQRRDTPFETLGASFTVRQGRIHSEDLVMATPDYNIYGEGWIGFDKTVKWEARLAMSPQFTQDLLKEHRNVRHLLDRQGRLSVPFRLDGTLPYVQTRPDLQALTEAIQKGLPQRGSARVASGETDERRRAKPDWIQKGLEQLFGK